LWKIGDDIVAVVDVLCVVSGWVARVIVFDK